MKIIKKNKQAYFRYFILKNYIAGIKLLGGEVKEIKRGNVNITESYIKSIGNELYLWNARIDPSVYATIEATRSKKLLLNKKEIEEIKRDLEQKGLTAIPTAVGLEHGLVKIEIGIAKGKKTYDKRDVIKERESDRYLRRLQTGKEV